MSVINQMLRDLDARDASAQERENLPKRLRPLPPTPGSRFKPWQMLALGLGAGMLVAGGAVSLYFTSAGSPEKTASVAVAPPAAATEPASPVAEPTPVAAAPARSAPPRPEPAKDEIRMKMATQLAAPKPETRPAPAAPPATTPAAARSAPAELALETQIDKRNAGSPSRAMAEAEYQKGMQAIKRGEEAVAASQLQRALELDPLHAKARQAMLSVLVGGRQWQEAQRVAQAGLALEPAQTGWAIILARLQFEQGDTPAALETLSRHAAHAANHADYHGLFAYLLQKQQRFGEAAQHFQTALALRPQEGRWWFGLGLALENTGRSGEARDAYARAREAGNLPADMLATIEQKLR